MHSVFNGAVKWYGYNAVGSDRNGRRNTLPKHLRSLLDELAARGATDDFYRHIGTEEYRKHLARYLRAGTLYEHNNQSRIKNRRVIQNKKLPQESAGWGVKNILPWILGSPIPVAIATSRLASKGKDASFSDWYIRSLYGDKRANNITVAPVLRKLKKLRKKGAKGIAFASFDSLQQDQERGIISKDQFNQLLHDLYFKGELYVPEDYEDPEAVINRTMTPTLRDYVKDPKKVVLDDVDESGLDPDSSESLVSRKLRAKHREDIDSIRISALRSVFPHLTEEQLIQLSNTPGLDISIS